EHFRQSARYRSLSALRARRRRTSIRVSRQRRDRSRFQRSPSRVPRMWNARSSATLLCRGNDGISCRRSRGTSMTSKAFLVRQHVRRAPRDPYADIKARTTEQLRREVEWMKAAREHEAFADEIERALEKSLAREMA